MGRNARPTPAGPKLAASFRRLSVLVLLVASAITGIAALIAPLASAEVGPSLLPDNRRYEMVSPVDKDHSDIDPVNGVASLDGNRLVFHSHGSFAGAQTAQVTYGLEYLATRGPSRWSTESIMPAGGELNANGYQAFSRDLSKGALRWPENSPQTGTLDPNAQPGLNLYMHDTADGSFTLVNGTLDNLTRSAYTGFVAWGSADLDHLAIQSENLLTVDAPRACSTRLTGNADATCAYEWDSGTLRLASILPNGKPVVGSPGNTGNGRECAYEHAISDDGSRLFFTSPPASFEAGQLYAREDGASTRLISESERTAPGGLTGFGVDFQNAEAAHGDRVLFTTRNSLLDADTDETNDLYLYDYAKPAGERLTLVSEDNNPSAPAGAAVDGGPPSNDPCGGVMGASEDLRRVYFVADNQILAGEPEAAGPKLYLWDDSGPNPTTTYIGTLNAADNKAWRGELNGSVAENVTRNAHVSADGRYLVFLSAAKLSGFENEGREEVYRYNAVANTTECASCSEDALPAEGEIRFEATQVFGHHTVYNHLPTNVTDTGQVFFQTSRGLIPADSNGKMDVYEYEGGQLALISSGRGPEDSFFLDASPSGNDVFFTTKDRLVGWDKDENADAYDARVGGGFPEPPPTPPACEGDACQPAPVVPSDPTPASSSFEGAGNLAPRARRCAKGRVRRHGRCLRRKHRKHSRHAKSATHNRG